MKHIVDARGLACPLPVVNTKNEIAKMEKGETVEVLVDNEIAVQNLKKFAKVRNHEVQDEKIAEDHYKVFIRVGSEPDTAVQEEITCEDCADLDNNVVVISSDKMGEGADELGASLMKAFVFALTKQDRYPKTILFYNGGARLTCEGADTLEDLKYLESQGVEIFTCGTCLNFYGLTEKLAVGGVTNMYDIVEKMNEAGKITKP